MKRIETELPDLILLELDVFGDVRGSFMELHQQSKYAALGLSATFVQDNVSRSRQNVLRGLHIQNPNPQGKLISVLHGQIWDVAVDVRVGSRTFGQWQGFELSRENHRQLYIPPGFLHGFVAQTDDVLVHYKCTHVYDPAGDFSVRWDDPTLAIQWPCEDPILSDKDANAMWMSEAHPRLPLF